MNTIKIIQGTTFEKDIKIYEGGKPYLNNENDSFRFGIKTDSSSNSPFFEKKWSGNNISEGTLKLELSSSQTKELSPGSYKYDLLLYRTIDGEEKECYSLIHNAKFIVVSSITNWKKEEDT